MKISILAAAIVASTMSAPMLSAQDMSGPGGPMMGGMGGPQGGPGMMGGPQGDPA